MPAGVPGGRRAARVALPAALDLDGDALFLDVDGTLLDIAARPDAVRVAPGLPALLDTLAGRLGGALALVTGRDIATVDRLFAPTVLAVAGIHGAELRLAGGEVRRAPPDPALVELRRSLERLVATRPGLLVEDKGRALAVHFRAIPEAGDEIVAAVAALVAAAGPGLAVQPGKMVVEIRPAGADKGAALRAFGRRAPFRGRRPVMVGDDWTDESAFAAALEGGGRALRVGRPDRPTAAPERLASPTAVRRWLTAHIAGRR